MDLQQQAKIIESIRSKMLDSIGQRVFVRVNLGRSRINENTGILSQAHPSVFVCELEYKRGRIAKQSFQYADILTGVVEVYQHYEPMFGPFNIVPDAPLIEPSKKPQTKKRLRPAKPIEQRIRLNSNQVAMLAERLKAQNKQTAHIPSVVKNKEIVLELSKRYDEKAEEEEIHESVSVSETSIVNADDNFAIEQDLNLGLTFDVDENLNVTSSESSLKTSDVEKISDSYLKQNSGNLEIPKKRRGRPPKNKNKL